MEPLTRQYVTPCLVIRGRRFAWGERTYVMAVLNASPDSFSGDGVSAAGEAAALARRFADEGADIVDIGAESTRPGAVELEPVEELGRLAPVLEAVRAATDLPVSVDTYHPVVAREALRLGADAINDVWGLRREPGMAAVVAEAGVPLFAMHNQRGRAAAADPVVAVLEGFAETLRIAGEAGIDRGRIVLDPGFGFGWRPEQNLELVRRLPELHVLGLPLLLGPSRKSTIGMVLGTPVEERVEGTAALVALGVAGGADIVRVHDVRAMARVARMADAVVRARWRPDPHPPAPTPAHAGEGEARAPAQGSEEEPRTRGFRGRSGCEVVIALGSNLGDRAGNLRRAMALLGGRGVDVQRRSSIWETAPVPADQPPFLNAVLAGRTALAPRALLATLKGIEQELGRRPGRRWGPRLIDLDILFCDEQVVAEADLQIPHPRIAERGFVLAPLSQVVRGELPVLGTSALELLERVGRDGLRDTGEQL